MPAKIRFGIDCQRYQAPWPQEVQRRGEDQHCTRRFTRRGEHSGYLPPGGYKSQPVLSLEQEFLEAGKKRLLGDTQREATSHEVSDLRKENEQLKQLVAELSLKNRVLKKSVTGME